MSANAPAYFPLVVAVIVLIFFFALAWLATNSSIQNKDSQTEPTVPFNESVQAPESVKSFMALSQELAAPSLPVSVPSTALSTEVTQPPQPFSDSGPPRGMVLKIKRSERQSAFGKVIFAIDARMEVSAENRALIQKYRLGSQIIYESRNREKYAQSARQHIANSHNDASVFDSGGRQALGIGKSFYGLARAAASATASALSLRITVDSLIQGHHIECKDMNELMDAESEIKSAAINLKAYLEVASTFTGQEETFEL